jgi:uncharacterized membrane protein
MIPWIIVAVVLVPLVVIAFVVTRRNTAAGELSVAGEDDAARERTESEFAAAEAYEEQWHEADKERFHQERLP